MPNTVCRAAFSVTWTTHYPDLIGEPRGRLVTRDGFTAQFDAGSPELGKPWHITRPERHWNRFWSSYLRRPELVRKDDVDADMAWTRVVPFQWWHRESLAGPAEAEAKVLVYPAAIAVSITVVATEPWPVGQLADALATLRKATTWAVGAGAANRNLDGIATELTAAAATRFLGADLGAPEPVEVYTVAAPVEVSGDLPGIGDPIVNACLPGLAVLGPPGDFDERRLLGANSHTRLVARYYLQSQGHAIWPPAVLFTRSADSVGCLLHNHTDLAAHLAALTSTARWAAGAITNGTAIPPPVHSLVENSVSRLAELHKGDRQQTYRSGIAKAQIEPLLPQLLTVDAAM